MTKPIRKQIIHGISISMITTISILFIGIFIISTNQAYIFLIRDNVLNKLIGTVYFSSLFALFIIMFVFNICKLYNWSK